VYSRAKFRSGSYRTKIRMSLVFTPRSYILSIQMKEMRSYPRLTKKESIRRIFIFEPLLCRRVAVDNA